MRCCDRSCGSTVVGREDGRHLIWGPTPLSDLDKGPYERANHLLDERVCTSLDAKEVPGPAA